MGGGLGFKQPGKGLMGEKWAATQCCLAVMSLPLEQEEGWGYLSAPGVPVTENQVPFAWVWPSILPLL